MMIAICSKCKLIFEDRGIDIADSQNVTLSNNYTKCPKCKSKARFLEGTFNFDTNGIATVLSAPQFTTEILDKIKGLLEQAQKRKITPEEFQKEVNNLPPLIRRIINLIIPKEPSAFWAMLGVLLMIINSLRPPKADEVPQKQIEAKPSSVETVDVNRADTTMIEKKEINITDDTLNFDNQ